MLWGSQSVYDPSQRSRCNSTLLSKKPLHDLDVEVIAHLFENMCVLKWQAVIDEIHAKRMCGFQAIRFICIIGIKIIIIS